MMVHIKFSMQKAETRQPQRWGHCGMRKMKERKKGKSYLLTVPNQPPIWWEVRPEIYRKCVDTALKSLSKPKSTNIFKILYKNARVLVFLPAHVCVSQASLVARGQKKSHRPREQELEVALGCQKGAEHPTPSLPNHQVPLFTSLFTFFWASKH